MAILLVIAIVILLVRAIVIHTKIWEPIYEGGKLKVP